MHTYGLYGLRLASAIALSGITEVEGTPDVVLDIGPTGGTGDGERAPESPDDVLLDWRTIGRFRVRSGCEIVFDKDPLADPVFLRAVVLGPVLAIVLLQRGLFPLHASAVDVEGRVLAFAAQSGGGKSTLTAALHFRGHGILGDDVAAIRLGPDRPEVLPGLPWIRLSLQACTRLGLDPARLPLAFSLEEEKRELPVQLRSDQEPAPLSHIYVLRDGPEYRVERAPRQAAFREIMGLCHGTRLPCEPITPRSWMDRSARLASGVPVSYLSRPRSLESLVDLAGRIEDLAIA